MKAIRKWQEGGGFAVIDEMWFWTFCDYVCAGAVIDCATVTATTRIFGLS